jgi:hypothetical protein
MLEFGHCNQLTLKCKDYLPELRTVAYQPKAEFKITLERRRGQIE